MCICISVYCQNALTLSKRVDGKKTDKMMETETDRTSNGYMDVYQCICVCINSASLYTLHVESRQQQQKYLSSSLLVALWEFSVFSVCFVFGGLRQKNNTISLACIYFLTSFWLPK